MLTLTSRGQLRRAIRDPALNADIRAVLHLRFEQMGGIGAAFHLIQPGDTIADAEAAVGWPMTEDDAPCWEWAKSHPGGIVEVTFIISDDGPAQVLIVPADAAVAIVELIRAHA